MTEALTLHDLISVIGLLQAAAKRETGASRFVVITRRIIVQSNSYNLASKSIILITRSARTSTLQGTPSWDGFGIQHKVWPSMRNQWSSQ